MADVEPDQPDKEKINLRITTPLLEEVDDTWKEQGFNSRSEFIRYILRDAVRNPELTRGEWRGIAISEHQIQQGETHDREEILEKYGLNE